MMLKSNSEASLKKQNFVFMNRIRNKAMGQFQQHSSRKSGLFNVLTKNDLVRVNKFCKPLLEQKRGRLSFCLIAYKPESWTFIVSTGSMARRKIGSSLNKVGEVYGVVYSNGNSIHFWTFATHFWIVLTTSSTGMFTKKSPGTADVKKRRIKYKLIDFEKKKKELYDVFTRIKPVLGTVSYE